MLKLKQGKDSHRMLSMNNKDWVNLKRGAKGTFKVLKRNDKVSQVALIKIHEAKISKSHYKWTCPIMEE